MFKFEDLKQYSEPDEPEDDFRIRLSQLVRERRDLEVEKLRKRFTSKLATLQGRLQRAEQRVDREEAQYKQRSWESALSIGATVLGAVFGRKLGSRTNVGRTTTSMRSVGRAASEQGDIGRAKENVETLQGQLEELEEKFQTDAGKIEDKLQVENLEFAELRVPPRKSDIQVEQVALVWTPWKVDASGIAEPAY